MFSLRKKTKAPPRPAVTGIRETVAGISNQTDQLVAIALDSSQSVGDRVTACEVVRSFVEFQNLSSVSEIWYATRELTDIDNPTEVRRAGWKLTQSCILHDEINSSAFTAYYAAITRRANVEDFDLVLSCLEKLTNDGKRLVGSQAPRQLPSILLEWIQVLAVRSQELRSNTLAQDVASQWGQSTESAFHRLLEFTIKLLKFNMPLWDPIDIEKLMLVAVSVVRSTSAITDCELCCNAIESVIAFGLMPAPVLQPVLEVLCGMIAMVPALRTQCVSIIRSLSRSHLQSSTFVRMCRILDTPSSEITQAMRIAAAEQLKDLLMSDMRAASATPNRSSPAPSTSAAASSASVATGGVLDDASIASTALEGLGVAPADVSLPIGEVFEAYYNTIMDPQTPLRLVLTLLNCCYELITDFGLLRRVHTASWLWPDDEVASSDIPVSPINMIETFSELCTKFEASPGLQDPEVAQLHSRMADLGRVLTDMLLDKTMGVSLSHQILTCVHISHFLETDACEHLLDAIEITHFCTPGVNNWLEHLRSVIDKIYKQRSDKCRAHVLRIVKDIYALDAEEEGWITPEDLTWISATTFEAISVADDSTLEELMKLYDEYVFYSDKQVFEMTTEQLVQAAIADNPAGQSTESTAPSVVSSEVQSTRSSLMPTTSSGAGPAATSSTPTVGPTAPPQSNAASMSPAFLPSPSGAGAGAATATNSSVPYISISSTASASNSVGPSPTVSKGSPIIPSAHTTAAVPAAPPSPNSSIKSVEALILAFRRAYKLNVYQGLIVLEALIKVCKHTFNKPDVFAKAWAVLCRLRSDRWDRVLIVNHRVEESYNAELRAMQEPLPQQLEDVHAVPSLVLKLKTKSSPSRVPPEDGQGQEQDDPDAFAGNSLEFDSLPILQIMLDVLRSPITSGRTLVLMLINASSQIAHYRILCEADIPSKLPVLRELRDELEGIVASGGLKGVFTSALTSPGLRSAGLNIVVHVLSVILPFKDLFSKSDRDHLVHTLVTALGKYNLATGWVVHCFTLSCYEAPYSLQRYLPQILSRLQLKITGRDSSMHILDFLLSLSLEGSLTKNFTLEDYKRVFGMCFSFIQNANDLLVHRNQADIAAHWLLRLAYSAVSNLFLSIRLESRRSLVPYLVRNLVLATRDPTWVDPMSFVVYDMINRFAYSDVPLRMHVDTLPKNEPGWEIRRWIRGVAVIEIRCNRITGEAIRVVRRPSGIFTTYMTPAVISGYDSGFDPLDMSEDGGVGNYTANFYMLYGQLGLGTFQYFSDSASKQAALRNRSGPLTNASASLGHGSGQMASNAGNVNHNTSISSGSATNGAQSGATDSSKLDESPNNTSSNNDSASSITGNGRNRGSSISTSISGTGNDMSASDEVASEHPFSGGGITPLVLPDDAATNRAMNSLDRVPIVDLYKVGIIYVAPGQNTEEHILSNSSGSSSYRRFLDRIGVLIRLKHNRMYYVGGLDTEQDLDGEYALAWSSKISQIIFHTITMMPNYPGDTVFASKKRHIGNDFVNIYFDESGEDFEFDIVKSQFNFINIVITPTYTDSTRSQQYWKVRAYRKEGMKNTLAAYDVKVVSDENLALFVRNLALKASQYAAIHNLGSEYTDNWVYRLQLICTLRDRVEQAKSEDDNDTAAVNGGDDDYQVSEDTLGPKDRDLKLLHWMDFTRFTR